MLQAFARPNRRRTFLLFALSGACLGAAVLVTLLGFNPVGLRGLLAFLARGLLELLAVGAFVVAFPHPWKTAKEYLRLIYASAAGLAVCVVLANAFEWLAATVGSSGVLHSTLDGASLICFFGALLVCPAGLLIGVIGALARHGREGHALLR
jgi:hypothetical protein